MVTRGQYRGVEYDVLNFTDDGEWVLRDLHGDVRLVVDEIDDRVSVQCALCGTFRVRVEMHDDGRWSCAGPCQEAD